MYIYIQIVATKAKGSEHPFKYQGFVTVISYQNEHVIFRVASLKQTKKILFYCIILKYDR